MLSGLVSMPNPDPRFYLHLALAYDRDGQEQKAQTAYVEAVNRGVQSQALTKGDKALLEEFQRKYGTATPASMKLRQHEQAGTTCLRKAGCVSLAEVLGNQRGVPR